MSALDVVAHWLRCPVCGDAMSLDDAGLRCSARHSFDVARQGYVNLLGRAAPKNADTAEMVAARDRFLTGGHYAPITASIARRLAGVERLLEVGAGTGHHLASALPPAAWGLAVDVSVPAARRAARAHPRVASVVADTWAGLPVRDGALDAVLCVFAPRNPAEFLRVLRPGGRVVVVVPNTGHLAGLRAEHGLLGIEEDKTERIESAFGSGGEAERISYDVALDAAAATDLVAMGPNAFHGARDVGATKVTIDVSILTFWPTLRK